MDIWLVFNECSTALKQLMQWKLGNLHHLKLSLVFFSVNSMDFHCLTIKKNCVIWIIGKILVLYAFMPIVLILSRMSEMCDNKQREQTGINQICLNECNRSTQNVWRLHIKIFLLLFQKVGKEILHRITINDNKHRCRSCLGFLFEIHPASIWNWFHSCTLWN